MTIYAYVRAPVRTARNAFFVTACIGAFTPNAFAQSRPTTSDEIVVTAPLEGAAIESLQGATVLNRDDVIDNLNGGLGDSLDALPGVASTFYGAGASRPIIRGLGDDRVRILENGIGAIDAASASPDHAVTADGLDASRIEILRGAAALAYGGNAIGGVVNVLDQSIPTHRGDGLSGDALVAFGSGNEGKEGSLGLTAGAGPVMFRLSAAGRDTEDYDIPGYANVGGNGAHGVAPNSWTRFRSYAGGASLTGDWGFAGLAVKRTTDDYGLPPEDGESEGGHIEMQQTRIEARGDAKVDWGPFTRVDFGAQHADYEHTEFEADGAPGTTFTNKGWEARVEGHRGGPLHGAIGLQASESDFAAEGEEGFITPTTTRDLGIFAVERWDRGAWGLEGGMRAEQRKLENEIAGDRDFNATSISLGAFMRPAENWFLGATLARTERAPTATELFADGPHLATASYEIGDPDSGKETALSLESSVRYTSSAFSFEFNLYRVNFNDYIALLNRGDIWYDDGGVTDFAPDESFAPPGAAILPVFAFTQRDANFTGGEISTSVRLFEAAGLVWRATGALDLVRARFDEGGALPRIPPRTTAIGVEAENTKLSARVELVDVAVQDSVAAFETETDGYQFINARIAWRPIADNSFTIRLDGRNLTDEEGRVHTSFLKNEYPLPGRSLRLTLSTDF